MSRPHAVLILPLLVYITLQPCYAVAVSQTANFATYLTSLPNTAIHDSPYIAD